MRPHEPLQWGRRDHRTLVQILSASLVGAIALGVLLTAIGLASQGLL